MGILNLLKGPIDSIIGSVGGIIDNLHTSDDEKLKAKLALAQLEKDFTVEMAQLEGEFAKTQADVIRAEATGASWLQRNWRPTLMLTFTYIVAHNFVLAPVFSIPAVEIPPDMWELLKLGIGGYILGRSGEKVVQSWSVRR